MELVLKTTNVKTGFNVSIISVNANQTTHRCQPISASSLSTKIYIHCYTVSFLAVYVPSCNNSLDCSDPWHAQCSNKKCICTTNHIAINNVTCYPILGGYCWLQRQCLTVNSDGYSNAGTGGTGGNFTHFMRMRTVKLPFLSAGSATSAASACVRVATVIYSLTISDGYL
ncbi:Protein of unknown function [Cotesia congregata]|uniref:EB domain-containing protein n=1 Tax=Cotesia congregata TaxID=51543 RepID=A0A8J2E796_COTCN|nr:Protein of unknown function [Cotesia congregata]